jgi:hypothetical protein
VTNRVHASKRAGRRRARSLHRALPPDSKHVGSIRQLGFRWGDLISSSQPRRAPQPPQNNPPLGSAAPQLVQKPFPDEGVPPRSPIKLGLFAPNLRTVLRIRMVAIARRISPRKLNMGVVTPVRSPLLQFYRHMRAGRLGESKSRFRILGSRTPIHGEFTLACRNRTPALQCLSG